MDNNSMYTHQEEDNDDNGINIGDLIKKYIGYWKWFFLSFALIVFLAYIKLNFTRPIYEAQSSIKIKSEQRGDKNKLSSFQELGGMSSGYKDEINDEIEIIKSRSLIEETIKSLHLNIKFFTKKNIISTLVDDNLGLHTEFFEMERYENPPLKLNFLFNDSLLYKIDKSFIITINSETKYTYSDVKKSFERKHAFGEKITTDFGNIIITPNVNLKKDSLINTSIRVGITPLKDITDGYVQNISIEANSEFSSIVNLRIADGRKQKTEDFLNTLVQKYNNRAVALKEELSKSTSEFVAKRLDIISKDLGDVDANALAIKSRYGISDQASKAGVNIQSSAQLEMQVANAGASLENITAMKELVAQNNNALIPNLGIGDGNTNALQGQYNKLMMEKNRLLKNSTKKNPTVVRINEQIQSIKQNITQGLNNLESNQKVNLESLNKQYSVFSSKVYAAPKQEKLVRDVQRQQQIKEALYLYLLRKREETAISLGAAEPNATVIDRAQSLPFPKSPKKKVFFLLAGLIGLLIPAAYLYVLDLLDTKIHTKEEVEKILNVPCIGDIPKLEGKNKRYLITKEDYSSTAEAFRILRTNVNFILSDSKKKKNGKVIFVTSTIAHEGKSLVSTNLATALALAGKRTLILGMDIRAPKIEPYLGVRGKIGVTNYIADSEIIPQDLLLKAPNVDTLDIISSGDLAPNPAELLMHDRVGQLFDFARENYEYIIVDTAAFSMVTDTMILSSFADAIIYVIRANFLDKRMLKYVKSLYNDNRLPKMSLLVNGVDHSKSYGYGYGYGTKFEKSKKWWQFKS